MRWGGGIVERAENFASVRSEVEHFVPMSKAPTPFSTWQWLSTWWNHFGKGKELLLLTVRNGKGEPLGIAPLYVESGKIELLGDTALCDYQDFIVVKGKEESFLRILLSFLYDSYGFPLCIHLLPAFSPLLDTLRALEQGRVYAKDTSPFILLPSSFEEYLLSLRQKQRHELRRKIRRIETKGEIGFCCTESQKAFDVFIKLHKDSAKKTRFLTPTRESFFFDIARLFAEQDWLRLFFLTFHQREIASLFCFQFKETLYVYNSGYDSEYSTLSPGIVLMTYAIRDSIERGLKEFNLLRGDERYKYHFGAKDLELYEVCIG